MGELSTAQAQAGKGVGTKRENLAVCKILFWACCARTINRGYLVWGLGVSSFLF